MEHSLDCKLSILICHLPEREREFGLLLDNLKRQSTSEVEVLVDSSPRGVPVGTKRNSLVSRATGEYCCFIDDDDDVSGDYVRQILDAVKSHPDCVGIEGIIKIGGAHRLFRHSIEFAGWYIGADAYYRTPNHLNPIRTELVKKVPFAPGASFGEDQDFSNRIRRFLKSEVYIGHPIYFYNSPL